MKICELHVGKFYFIFHLLIDIFRGRLSLNIFIVIFKNPLTTTRMCSNILIKTPAIP